MANSFNLSCNHERFCHPWCFERVYRQCYRLTEALRKVYGDELPLPGHFDKRKAMTDALMNRHENVKKVCDIYVFEIYSIRFISIFLYEII